MSMLPPDVQPALSQLLRALGSPDNTLRTQAEEQLNNDWIQGRPDVLLMGLVEQIQGAEDIVVSRRWPAAGDKGGRGEKKSMGSRYLNHLFVASSSSSHSY